MTDRAHALQLLRDSRRWSQGELAAAIGRSQSEVSRWESGSRQIPDDILELVAESLEVEPEAFELLSRTRAVTGSAVHYRSLKSVSSTAKRQLEAELTVVAVAIDQLLDGLEFHTDHQIPSLQGFSPQKAAQTVRAAWRLPSGPIRTLTPVLEAAGIFIVPHTYGGEPVTGMSTVSPAGHVVMTINVDAPWDRVRFTLCHELAHIVLHHDGVVDDDIEQEAHAFARFLLMPEHEFVQRVRQTGTDLQAFASTKQYWRTSIAAQVTHATRLGLIPKTAGARLHRQINARGWKKQEPVSISAEPTSLLDELVQAHAELGTGPGQLRKRSAVLDGQQIGEFIARRPVPARRAPAERTSDLSHENGSVLRAFGG